MLEWSEHVRGGNAGPCLQAVLHRCRNGAFSVHDYLLRVRELNSSHHGILNEVFLYRANPANPLSDEPAYEISCPVFSWIYTTVQCRSNEKWEAETGDGRGVSNNGNINLPFRDDNG